MPGNLISITPAEIATWPTPNYKNPVERQWLPKFSGAFLAVATVMVSTRLWLRFSKQAGGLGLDDLLLVIAWLGSVMFTTVLIVASVDHDIGRHIWDIPLPQYASIAQWTWLAELSFLITGGCTKISVLLFYRRLTDGSYARRWKWAVLGAVGFTAAYTVAFILALIFNCNPTEAYWKAFDPNWHHDYTCADTTVINLLAGICAVISDFYSVILPCIMTSNFDLPRSQKIALNVVFSLGILVVGASAVRTYFLYEVGHNSDVSWMMFGVFVWADVELMLGLICASAPALRVFFRTYVSGHFNRAVNATRSYSSRQDNHTTSQLSGRDIRRISGPEDHCQRDDFNRGHYFKPSVDEETVVETELESGSPQSTAPSSHYLIKSPAEYEAYNLSNMEKYRLSEAGRRDSKERAGRDNYSRPFGHAPTPSWQLA